MNNIKITDYGGSDEAHEQEIIDSNLNLPFENILHDMKTPMHIMYAFINELEGNLHYDMSALNTVGKIKNHWYKIMKLVNDASDFRRINNGLLTPTLRNLDIIYLIREITNSTKVLSDRKNISLNFFSDISTCVMSIDKNIIERILLNLLSNSVKFTGEGGLINVTVTSENEHLFITVKDNGIGIDSEKMNSIFDKYYSDNNEFNTQGVGLGLYIVKQLVSLLNGNIYISSTEGTEITVSIPIIFIENLQAVQNRYSNFYDDNIIQIELSDEY